jgi:altronate dehydratase small subunit
MPAKRALIMQPTDNVATALEEIQPGDEVAAALGREARVLRAIERIPFGFKIALGDIPPGAIIRKYGEVIGKASVAIAKGALVHIHNLEGTRARGDREGRDQP